MAEEQQKNTPEEKADIQKKEEKVEEKKEETAKTDTKEATPVEKKEETKKSTEKEKKTEAKKVDTKEDKKSATAEGTDTKKTTQTSTSAVQKEDTTKAGTKKDGEAKADLERIYVVPLRRGFLKVPRHKRAKKAVKTLKEFIAKHMKVVDRDLTKVKVDKYLNNEIWFRGIKKPLPKVKVKARKVGEIVHVELAEMPDYVVYKRGKDEKKKRKVDKKKLDKVVAQEAAEEKLKQERSDSGDKAAEKEKEKAGGERNEKIAKDMAKTDKHTAKAKSTKLDTMSQTSKRKALKK